MKLLSIFGVIGIDDSYTFIISAGSPALETARPYLKLRAFSFLPMMISFVGFSTLRGTKEVALAVKITIATSLLSAVLDPLLIHVLGFGVRGSALAGLGAEYSTAAIYLKLLLDRNLLRLDKLTKLPAWGSVAPLIKGSVALQIRSFAMNLTQLAAARVIQSIDDAGVAPAAHALAVQTFQLGGILFGALGMATQTLVPSALANKEEGKEGMKAPSVHVNTLVNRLLCWGVSMGVLVSIIQFSFLPGILKSSPLVEVRDAARVPTLISISMQAINAIVSIGEGTMMGYGGYVWMSVNIVTASLGYVTTLRFLPQKFGLEGVWMCMATFTAIRMTGSIAFLVTKMRQGSKKVSLSS
jgi:Na+-driven multidrug efflux pump